MGDNGLNAGTIAAMGAAGVLLLGALATAVGKVVTAVKDAKLELMHASERRQVETDKKLAEITSHVNGASSAMTAKIDGLERALASTIGQLAEQKQVAAVLAQSQSTKEAPQASALPAPVAAPAPVEVKIVATAKPVEVIVKK